MKPITEIVSDLGLSEKYSRAYGKYKAKIALEAMADLQNRKRAKVVLVTAITPTPSGEGKTVTAIGLSSAINRLGHKSIVCIRQPSLGPLFGIKGGAAGGGKSTVEPMQDINMRFNGDIDAIAAAHNLLSAMLDNHIYHGNELNINPRTMTWKRTIDMNDRALRHVVVGLLGGKNTVSRDDSFVITAASEVMAIVGLARDYADLKKRLDKILVGFSETGSPIWAMDLKASGAMSALLRDALEPNLVQTSDQTPALVHCGPFGNIATGTSSLVSILLGASLTDYCIVEAGFGSDLGAEKFIDIVARLGQFNVDAAVLVVSVKALKYHGLNVASDLASKKTGGDGVTSGHETKQDEMGAGIENMKKHLENVRSFGISPVVAINRFPADTDSEILRVIEVCKDIGVPYAISNVFSQGATGGLELAERVLEAVIGDHTNRPVYELSDPIENKIKKVVTQVYGGEQVNYDQAALDGLVTARDLDLSESPICIAKTAFSLSDDPKKLGRPVSFSVRVSRIGISSGAGFSVPFMGEIMTMPGLPKHPAAENMYISDKGEIFGIF